MNTAFKHFFNISLLVSVAGLSAMTTDTNQTFGKTFFAQRSQGSNVARQWVGWSDLINRCDMDCVYGALAITPEYTRSFDTDKVGQFLFFNGSNEMTFGPAAGAGVDVFARNFFLNDDFDGKVVAKPRVENFLVDIDFYLGLDEWTEGLWFRIHAPINWTRWDMNFEETRTNQGSTIAANKLGNDAAAPSPINTIDQGWAGQTLNTNVFEDLRRVMESGRVQGRQTKTGLADIEAALGYNFICNCSGYFGVNLRAIFPTGNRPDNDYFFEPVIGNGKHFELGGGLIGHYQFSNDCNSSFNIYGVANVYHMFKARQRRTFDLTANGPGSRYLLVKRFMPGDNPSFTEEVLFGPNVFTLDCKVKNDVHVDGIFMLNYINCGFTFDIGYNLWVRTEDKIDPNSLEQLPPQTFGLAGNTSTDPLDPSYDQTASNSRINGENINDFDMVFITSADLNIESSENPTALSHKAFVHFGYMWENCDYTPFLGIGGEVEFSGRKNNALDQWGAWIKGGFGFA